MVSKIARSDIRKTSYCIRAIFQSAHIILENWGNYFMHCNFVLRHTVLFHRYLYGSNSLPRGSVAVVLSQIMLRFMVFFP